MSYFNTKQEFSLRDLLYRALIFIGTVGVIVYFLPRDGKFNYQFDIDKPWKYGQLMATFDFPIYKSDEVVKHEQDSIFAAFQPYFQLDKSVEKSVIAKLKTDYQNHLRHLLPSTDYVRFLEKKLTEVYRAGIVATEELARLHKDSVGSIMVIDDKLANQQDIGKVYSVKDAYNYVLTADTAHYRPDILRQCSLNEYLFPNLTYDETRTETAKKEVLDNYSWANGLVLSGQKIIDRGEIVSRETYSVLESLRKESIKRSESIGQKRLMLAGQVLFVGIFMLCFMLYLDLFRKDYYKRKGSLSLLFALITFYCVVTAVMVANNIFNVYIIPYAMLPIIIRVFLDSRTAFIAQAATILICSVCLRYPHEFILLQLSAGLVAIFSLRELSQRSQLFRTAFLVILTYAAVYFAFELITENDLSKLNGSMYTYFIINGVLLLFTYPLLFLVEKTFGFTSNVTLVELSNINTALLRRMSETVPGTFQHSMQVANLAAEAANRIGAKSQLVRTGALYHDIGKMENPVFFTENQSGGVNPHKNLGYEQSAQVVISHVTDGLKLAEKHNLPKAVKDFITTHHGRGKTKYFYISWQNEHPGEEPNEEAFTYPGPNPFTKEQAILMMADSVEAASRSLPEYTEESISNLVEKIIDSQVAEGYFKECPITFKDIATVKAVFKEKLKTIYHTRISYPELKKIDTMEVTRKEQKRAERLLQSRHVGLQEIKSFSFMKRYRQTPAAKEMYGPGILTLHLKEGKEKALYLPPFRHPSSVVRYLLSQGIPFDNYAPRQRTAAEVPTETYRRPSLYMFWFFVLFLMFLILGYYALSGNVWWGFIPAAVSFALSLFFICMLMTRFCYLTLDNDGITIHSVGRTLRYPYHHLRKVNFDFAREQNFTHVMELLDGDYRYRLFYIGRVSRKRLNEIAGRLQQAGVDATCSLNDRKRYYQDRVGV